MVNVIIDSEHVSEVKVGGDWYSIKHGSLQIGEMMWRNTGPDTDGSGIDAGQLGFMFEIYGSQALVMAGPLTAITGVRYNKPV